MLPHARFILADLSSDDERVSRKEKTPMLLFWEKEKREKLACIFHCPFVVAHQLSIGWRRKPRYYDVRYGTARCLGSSGATIARRATRALAG